MKIYHRYNQLFKPQYANGRVYFIPDWSQCDCDAVFLLHREEIPFMFMRSIEVGDYILSHYLPWKVRVVAFPMLEPGVMVVRADAYPLMWIWRALQWQMENTCLWWLFKRFKDVGMLDCEPGQIPSWKNIRLPRFLERTTRKKTIDAEEREELQERLDELYGDEQAQWIGDSRCKYNAWSPYLGCAVNPSCDCANCSYFEMRSL